MPRHVRSARVITDECRSQNSRKTGHTSCTCATSIIASTGPVSAVRLNLFFFLCRNISVDWTQALVSSQCGKMLVCVAKTPPKPVLNPAAFCHLTELPRSEVPFWTRALWLCVAVDEVARVALRVKGSAVPRILPRSVDLALYLSCLPLPAWRSVNLSSAARHRPKEVCTLGRAYWCRQLSVTCFLHACLVSIRAVAEVRLISRCK